MNRGGVKKPYLGYILLFQTKSMRVLKKVKGHHVTKMFQIFSQSKNGKNRTKRDDPLNYKRGDFNSSKPFARKVSLIQTYGPGKKV